MTVSTSNHYLRAMKQFTRWLVRDRRMRDDPLIHLSMVNVKVDRRHDRRALLPDEFARLVAAARVGKPVESMAGPDRAMMYVLSAWTGYRKGEIGSLTTKSFDLLGDPPTVTVAAAYSKRRRQDTQVLHCEVVQLMQEWLVIQGRMLPERLWFPVSGSVPGGTERKTAKMMRVDLAAARNEWIAEASTDDEKELREATDFLAYCDHRGRYADFHSNRHTFITSLSRNHVSPRTAQTLARHSDIRLTMQTYTHIELADQQAAIASLPAPPRANAPLGPSGVAALQTTQLVGSPNRSPRGPTRRGSGTKNSGRGKTPRWSADDLRFFRPQASSKGAHSGAERLRKVPKLVPYSSHQNSYTLHHFAPKVPQIRLTFYSRETP